MKILNSRKPPCTPWIAIALLALAGSATASSVILAGWHDFSSAYGLYKTSTSPKSADEYLSGISASLYGGDGTRDTWGSTDGTYGVLNAVETSATDGAMAHRTDKPNMYITIQNNTGSDAVLDSIVFDLASVLTSSPRDLALYYDSGDLAVADNTQINSTTGVNANGLGNVSDYQDFDWSLASLSDQTLATGESAVFRFTVANAINNVQALALDNLAVIGQGTAGDPLTSAMTALKNHIIGSGTLTASEINGQAGIISSKKGQVGNNAANISQALDLVETYETVKGALFLNGTTSADGGFSRSDTSTANKALALAMLTVYQAIIDDVYNASNLAGHRSLLDGAKFESADYFPGAVIPPADSNAVYSVQINASQPKAWGFPVMYVEDAARRPTGAYLAPGSIVKVTVPASLVNQGFKIRVGAHVHDLSAKSTVKRIDRVSVTYPITGTTTEVANPLGGGIYIEVPYEKEKGIVTVEIQNAVRSPFYSNTSARQTTLSEWQNTERNHPGPWADFESDKFMLNVPASWIYNYADPVTMMSEWDDAMDAVSDLIGLPRVRPKTVLYGQIDVLIRSGAFAPGYPQSNHSYNPRLTFNGNYTDKNYLAGPKFLEHHHLHELGHACLISKFTGETEATVNLLYVPVHNQKFGVSLDESFGRSMGNYGCRTVSRDQAALLWILSDKFRAGNVQAATDMKYQHRGYGKYVEIAGLFGWEALSSFWHSVAVDYENGITYPTNTEPTDSRIIRMSRAAGADLTPLIHFWGVHPNNAASIKSALASEGIGKSALIYDRLVRYKTVVPMTLSAFESHYQKVRNAPIDSDFFDTMRSSWNATYAQASIARVQEIIDLYFPNGRPAQGTVQSLPYAESFETGIGEWVQSADDELDWSLNSGYTDTTNTGPSAASDGTQYLYIEGHDNPGVYYKSAMLECRFDLSTVDNVELGFDYHMFGPYIDYLSVDVYDGSSWTSNTWTSVGQQQTSSESTWSNAVVNLSAFAGNSEVTIRFRAKQKQWSAGDMAIDNIRVEGVVLAPYDQWATGMFSNAPFGTDQSGSGNPDGDALDNAMEWALTTDPLVVDRPSLTASISDPNFIVTYDRRDPALSGMDVHAAWADSLTSAVWRVNGDGMTEVSIGWSGDIQTMAVLVPLDATNRFIRLDVQQ